MKSDFNPNLTGDDLLTVVKKVIAGKVPFYIVASKGGKPPETLDVSWRLAAAWNTMQGLSNTDLERLEPGAVKRLLGDQIEPLVIEVTDFKVLETTS